MENQYTIHNEENCLFVSDLLKEFLTILDNRENVSISEINKYTCSNSKSIEEFIVSFAVSFAVDLAMDLLKYCISKLKNRPDYDKNYKIRINGVEYTIEEIEAQ